MYFLCAKHEKHEEVYGESMPTEQAVDKAVDTCIDEGILRNFLLKHKSEVKRMSIFEWDEEEYLKSEREVWREEGMAEGLELGISQGITQGLTLSIIALLEELGEIPDSLRARLESETDAELLRKLLKMATKSKDIHEFTENYETMGEVECQ